MSCPPDIGRAGRFNTPGPLSGLYRLGRKLRCNALRYEGKRMNRITELLKDEVEGSAVEYAFLASSIAPVIAVSVTLLGSQLNAAYSLVASKVKLG